MTNPDQMDEIIRMLETGHAVLVVRVDHHDARLEDLVDEQKWLRRLVISTLMTAVLTLAATIVGFMVGV